MTLHFSMTGNFFSMTRNFFASPGNFFAFDSLHFWMTKKCTERLKGVFCCCGREREALPTLVLVWCMRTFCESESGGKSAKRDLGVAVFLPPWFYHPWVYQSCFHAVGIYYPLDRTCCIIGALVNFRITQCTSILLKVRY